MPQTEHETDAETLNARLEDLNQYIVTLARNKRPRNHVQVVFEEIDDLAQRIRIKLWDRMRKAQINHTRAYVRRIADTEYIDMHREKKPVFALDFDEYGEPLGDVLINPAEGFRDPAYEVELGEVSDAFLVKLVNHLLALPPREQVAVFWSLKEKLEEIIPLLQMLEKRGIDLEAVSSPQQKEEIQRLRSLLSVARRKLRPLLHHEPV